MMQNTLALFNPFIIYFILFYSLSCGFLQLTDSINRGFVVFTNVYKSIYLILRWAFI